MLVMETAALIAYSGGGEGVNVNDVPDESNDDNRSRGLRDLQPFACARMLRQCFFLVLLYRKSM